MIKVRLIVASPQEDLEKINFPDFPHKDAWGKDVGNLLPCEGIEERNVAEREVRVYAEIPRVGDYVYDKGLDIFHPVLKVIHVPYIEKRQAFLYNLPYAAVVIVGYG